MIAHDQNKGAFNCEFLGPVVDTECLGIHLWYLGLHFLCAPQEYGPSWCTATAPSSVDAMSISKTPGISTIPKEQA